MGAVDVVVVLAAVGLIASLGWFFFGPRRAGAARLEGGVQRVQVTVRGGYSPNLIKVRQGTPVELIFDRQESGECTSAWSSPNSRSVPDCPPIPAPRCGSARTGRAPSGSPAA